MNENKEKQAGKGQRQSEVIHKLCSIETPYGTITYLESDGEPFPAEVLEEWAKLRRQDGSWPEVP